jgi:hypothetical protein
MAFPTATPGIDCDVDPSTNLTPNPQLRAGYIFKIAGHLQGAGTVLAAPAAGAALGTGPPAIVPGSSTDQCGLITFGTGTTPAAGSLMTVSFATAYAAAPKAVILIPINAATQALGLYCPAPLAGSFAPGCTVAPAASQGNTVYGFMYIVIG